MSNENPPLSIEDISDPERLAKVARNLLRYHRPDVEPVISHDLNGPNINGYVVYDERMAVDDALEKSSIVPILPLNRGLRTQVIELTLQDFPNYDAIMERRWQKKEDLESKG